jgi:hypothetical protein
MVWKNRATTRSIRLNKRMGDIHYEITQNLMSTHVEPFILEGERVSEGLRTETAFLTAEQLLQRFSDIAEWECVLYAYEQLKKERLANYALAKEIQQLKSVGWN